MNDISLPARYPTVAALLALWERPWSTSALRFASHRLAFLVSRGLDVMEVRR